MTTMEVLKGVKMKQILSITLLIFISIAISPAAKAANNGNVTVLDSQRPQFSAQQSNSQDRVRAYLAREVRHELVMLPYYSVFDWLQFEVNADGAVVLRGQVTRPTLKSDAENIVKNIEGVTNVVNQIEVLPLSPNDDRIRRAVFRALFSYNSPLFRYGLGAVPPIHIIVKNGNVTLKGIVDNQSDANIANIRANGVSGVFSVRNELTVANNRRS